MSQEIETRGALFTDAVSRKTKDSRAKSLVIVDKPSVKSLSLKRVLNKVIQGDALRVLKKMPEESVDCIFVDPPYFLQLPKKQLKRWNVKTDVEGVDDEWDKFASFDEYDEFIRNLLTEARRVMKPSATIWVIATYHSIFRIGKIMQDIGYWMLNDVVWLKTNPMPNWLGVRFTNATETLVFALKDKTAKKYTFSKEWAREFGVGKVGANVWVLPLCNGKERIKDEDGKKLHSTQKPVELLKRVILTSTNKDDVILDPVAGAGTTGYVAQALGRNFVMIEVNARYVEGIKRRFTEALPVTVEKHAGNAKKRQTDYLKLETEE